MRTKLIIARHYAYFITDANVLTEATSISFFNIFPPLSLLLLYIFFYSEEFLHNENVIR